MFCRLSYVRLLIFVVPVCSGETGSNTMPPPPMGRPRGGFVSTRKPSCPAVPRRGPEAGSHHTFSRTFSEEDEKRAGHLPKCMMMKSFYRDILHRIEKEMRIFFNHEQRLKFPAATIYSLPSLPVT